jgi:hypothetical protein
MTLNSRLSVRLPSLEFFPEHPRRNTFFRPSRQARRCIFVFQTMHFRVCSMVSCLSKHFKNASSGWSRSQKRLVTQPNTEVMTRLENMVWMPQKLVDPTCSSVMCSAAWVGVTMM